MLEIATSTEAVIDFDKRKAMGVEIERGSRINWVGRTS